MLSRAFSIPKKRSTQITERVSAYPLSLTYTLLLSPGRCKMCQQLTLCPDVVCVLIIDDTWKASLWLFPPVNDNKTHHQTNARWELRLIVAPEIGTISSWGPGPCFEGRWIPPASAIHHRSNEIRGGKYRPTVDSNCPVRIWWRWFYNNFVLVSKTAVVIMHDKEIWLSPGRTEHARHNPICFAKNLHSIVIYLDLW